MKKLGRGIGLGITMGTVCFLAMGCSPQSQSQSQSPQLNGNNLVRAGDPNTVKKIDRFTVLGTRAFKSKVDSQEITLSSNVPLQPSTLLFSMPTRLLNQPMVLGAVIVGVSNQNNEELGGLKLSDLPPYQVVLTASTGGNSPTQVAVMDCGADCSKPANQKLLFNIPVVGVDNAHQTLVLDLASLGKNLDLLEAYKDNPDITLVLANYHPQSSETVTFDYSASTLVFDVQTHLTDKTHPQAAELLITNRWYIKLGYTKLENGFNPSFMSRNATAGVGFFMTERSLNPLIERWDFDQRGQNDGIQYYIKHVPAEFQPAFAAAFDDWNQNLLPIIGKKVFSYEFIPEGDPRNDLLVAGDVRYNVVEWDLVNKAGYGGLGPSTANQYTGEIFHSNVLIQGPTIVDLYTNWFKAQQTAAALMASGNSAQADHVLLTAHRSLQAQMQPLTSRKFQLRLGPNLKMKIRSQEPSLEDPLMAKDTFDLVPIGISYEEYMTGYFHDMVAHELGHDLGLRHNFRGSLAAAEGTPTLGAVSRSVMEYLGRDYRYLDHVDEYDLMAIAYGYTGAMPTHTDWYCTDEDSADLNDPTQSAECSSNDATDDPFSHFQAQLDRAIQLLVGRDQNTAPDWTVDDMKDNLQTILVGIGSYAESAALTANSWTNFFSGPDHPDRPHQASQIRKYVLSQLKAQLCDPSLDDILSAKNSDTARAKAQSNLADLRARAVGILKPVFSGAELACSSPSN